MERLSVNLKKNGEGISIIPFTSFSRILFTVINGSIYVQSDQKKT